MLHSIEVEVHSLATGIYKTQIKIFKEFTEIRKMVQNYKNLQFFINVRVCSIDEPYWPHLIILSVVTM
jgi:hypothetical protein